MGHGPAQPNNVPPADASCHVLADGTYPASLPCACIHAKSLQLCPTLCNPKDCSLPGSSVRGILQARMLEWVAISSSRGSSPSRDRAHTSCGSCIGRRVRYHRASPVCLILSLFPSHTEPWGTVSHKGIAHEDKEKGTSVSSLET